MKVSIIIPVYNCGAFLKRSLEAVLQQTYLNKEIIIVDDASSDDSFAIAKTFESATFKVIQQKNSGAAVARNTGLQYATGTYIQFLDADDYLSADKIEKQVAALAGSLNKVAVCNYTSFTNDEEIASIKTTDQSSFIYNSISPEDFLINLWGGNGASNFIQTNCWLVPIDLIKKAGNWRNYRCPDDDGEFFARVLLASEGIVYVPGIMNYYRRANTAHKLSANPNKKYIQNTLLNIDLKYQYLKTKSNDKRVEKAFAKQYLDFAVHNYPNQKILSTIALKRYKKMNQPADLPLLGGRFVEIMKLVFGWKLARYIKYFFNR